MFKVSVKNGNVILIPPTSGLGDDADITYIYRILPNTARQLANALFDAADDAEGLKWQGCSNAK
jgi:hypothetical protein